MGVFLPIRYIGTVILIVYSTQIEHVWALLILLLWSAIFAFIGTGRVLGKRAKTFSWFIVMVLLTLAISDGVPISSQALTFSFLVTIRLLIGFLAMNALVGKQGFLAWIDAMQRFKLPAPLITLMYLMHRYIYYFFEHIYKKKMAMRLRYTANKLHFKSWGYAIGYTFVQSYEQSDTLYMAMKSRGATGELLVRIPQKSVVGTKDVIWVVSYVAVMVGSVGVQVW